MIKCYKYTCDLCKKTIFVNIDRCGSFEKLPFPSFLFCTHSNYFYREIQDIESYDFLDINEIYLNVLS